MGVGVMEKKAVRFTKEEINVLKRIAKEQKLKGAYILDKYTDDEIIASFNGAGSSAAPELERYILTKLLKKKLPAVLIHDMMYRQGGTDEDFKRVNDELRDNILALDGDSKSAWWRFVGDKARDYSNERGRPGWGTV